MMIVLCIGLWILGGLCGLIIAALLTAGKIADMEARLERGHQGAADTDN